MQSIELRAKGVIWDFDGTILDSFGLHETMMNEVMSKRGMPLPSPESHAANYHGRLKDSIHAISGATGALLDELYEDFIQGEEHHYEDTSNLYFPDAVELLVRNHHAGLKQIIVSNRSHHSDTRLGSPRNLAKRPPLQNYIDSVVCGDDNEFHKPDARMLDAAEESLGLRRSDFIVIGDQFVDAVLAHNLGVRAVLIARHEKSVPHLDRLENGWESMVTIVSSLDSVSISLAK